MSIGALLENICIAASCHGMTASIARRADSEERTPVFDVYLAASSQAPDPLADHIQARSVQRRPLSTQPLTMHEKQVLEASVGPGYRVIWIEGGSRKRQVARLLWISAKLRLSIPEAYAVHRDVIAWGARFSEDRVPQEAIGIDPVGALLMAWVMQSWERVEFFNKYLGGTLLPRIQLDLIPGLRCAAHFAIVPYSVASDIDGYVAAGRAMQRYWLTATRLGLKLQPQMTPLIFAAYARLGRRFSRHPGAGDFARAIEHHFAALLGAEAAAGATFFGRVGHGPAATARSTRLPLEKLLVHTADSRPG
jgi:hypothetical protein